MCDTLSWKSVSLKHGVSYLTKAHGFEVYRSCWVAG